MSMGEKLEIIAENVPKVYEAGKQAEQKAFWETYQIKGKRTNWQYAFAYANCWTDETYNPIYPIKVSTSHDNMYYNATITDTKVPIIVTHSNLKWMFRESTIVTIPELNLSASTKTFTDPFDGATKLKNITVTGTIAGSIKFSSCPLSVASIKSIISCLKDFTGGSEYSCTLTLKSSAFSSVKSEGATAEYNGVACTWEELVDNKKWNLTLA